MKKILFILFLLPFVVHSQTTPFTITLIPNAQPDLTYHPNRGLESWTTQYVINNPVQGTNTPPSDAYYRMSWYQIQSQSATGPGLNMNFTIFDAQVNAAITAGQGFSFGIMNNYFENINQVQTAGGAGYAYPTLLHTQMQAESTKDLTVGNQWYENTNSVSLRTWFKAREVAISNHIASTSFNGVPYSKVVKRVDARIMGDFGENIVLPAKASLQAVNGVPTSAAIDSLLDVFRQAYSNLPSIYVVNMIGIFSGGYPGPSGVGVTPVDAGAFALQLQKNGHLYGWRRDNWGQTDNYIRNLLDLNTNVFGGFHFDSAIMNRWQYAPVCGEPQDGGSAGNFPDLPIETTRYHEQSLGNGNFNNGVNATIQNNFRAAALLMGYRLQIPSGNMTTTLVTNGAFSITLGWQNIGTTSTYEDWNVQFELRNGTTVVWTGTSSKKLKFFQPGGVINTTDNFTATGVGTGTYGLYLICRDSLGYRAPIPLGITGRNPDGSYLLRGGIVVGASGTPVANAGANQTITLPISSVTLDGTGSSGTISSYAWTKVSGPAGPVIATPTTATTVVNGFVAGVYVFQLSINGGASVSTTQVTVNPALPSYLNVFPTQTPSGGVLNDGQSLEVGMRFQSSVAGQVLGVRFYKVSGNTGTHIGELYTNAGARLAQATFTGETATGWQQVLFTTPITITANTTYMVAYWSSLGNYAADNNYFTANVVNGVLTGLADASPGNPNGVFSYSNVAIFPTSTFNKSNYWVDVLFAPNPSPPPPTRLPPKKKRGRLFLTIP